MQIPYIPDIPSADELPPFRELPEESVTSLFTSKYPIDQIVSARDCLMAHHSTGSASFFLKSTNPKEIFQTDPCRDFTVRDSEITTLEAGKGMQINLCTYELSKKNNFQLKKQYTFNGAFMDAPWKIKYMAPKVFLTMTNQSLNVVNLEMTTPICISQTNSWFTSCDVATNVVAATTFYAAELTSNLKVITLNDVQEHLLPNAHPQHVSVTKIFQNNVYTGDELGLIKIWDLNKFELSQTIDSRDGKLSSIRDIVVGDNFVASIDALQQSIFFSDTRSNTSIRYRFTKVTAIHRVCNTLFAATSEGSCSLINPILLKI